VLGHIMVRDSIMNRGPRACARRPVLGHITASPGKIGDIVKSALVLTRFEHDRLNWKSVDHISDPG
jgi:hypothetical protein